MKYYENFRIKTSTYMFRFLFINIGAILLLYIPYCFGMYLQGINIDGIQGLINFCGYGCLFVLFCLFSLMGIAPIIDIQKKRYYCFPIQLIVFLCLFSIYNATVVYNAIHSPLLDIKSSEHAAVISILMLFLGLIIFSIGFIFNIVCKVIFDRIDQKRFKKEKSKEYTTIVNFQNKLTKDNDLIMSNRRFQSISTIFNEQYLMDQLVCQQFFLLKSTLYNETGILIGIESGYRSELDQETLLKQMIVQYGTDYCKKYVAQPGYSEHHTGMAIDINVKKNNNLWCQNNNELMNQEEKYKIIHSYLNEYGFILRYPKGKEEITGVSYEPWHIRFVGRGIAKQITKANITLEEFVQKYKDVSKFVEVNDYIISNSNIGIKMGKAVIKPLPSGSVLKFESKENMEMKDDK